jgi:hypothetical protein
MKIVYTLLALIFSSAVSFYTQTRNQVKIKIRFVNIFTKMSTLDENIQKIISIIPDKNLDMVAVTKIAATMWMNEELINTTKNHEIECLQAKYHRDISSLSQR